MVTVTLIPRNVNLGEISFKLISVQDFANAGQTDNMSHNIIAPKVPSGV